MKRFLVFLGFALLFLIVAILANTFRFASRQFDLPAASFPTVDSKILSAHLAGALRFKTISYQDPSRVNNDEFLQLHQYLEKVFPLTHSVLTREKIGGSSLLYTWAGDKHNLRPVLLLSHLDVVPVETENRWTHLPFQGDVADGYVWGRGALDDKSGVIAILEAVELLLQKGHRPQRTIYLAFGQDEEVGGNKGAAQIAALLKSRGVRTECTLDEGGAILEGMIKGISQPVAMIGIAEKGYVNIELTVQDVGGHSSMPPPKTVIGRLSQAVHNLETHPFQPHLSPALKEMFLFLGPEMTFPRKIVAANLWLLRPLVTWSMGSEPKTAAWLHTTAAPTIIEGGFKENVLPGKARAVVNFRILPGDTVQEVVQHVIRSVRDPKVNVKVTTPNSEPSSVSDTRSESFRVLQKTISQTIPNVFVSPYLLSGGTDSRHYESLSGQVFRFLPIRMKERDLERVHGIDERISVENFKESVLFYRQFLLNW